MTQSYSNYLGSGNRSSTSQITCTTTFTGDDFYNNGRDLSTALTGSSVSGTWFMGVNPVAGKYLRFDFLCAPRIIDKVKIYSVGSSAGDVYRWQGLDPLSGSWVNLGSTFSLDTATSSGTEYNLSNSTAYASYRMLGVSGTSSNPNLDFEFSIDDTVTSGYIHAKISADSSLSNATTWTTSGITTTADAWLVAIFFGEHPGAQFGITSITDSDGLTWTKRSQLQNHTSNAYCDNEIWYARRTTPSSGTVTFHFSSSVDDASYTIVAVNNLPNMSSLWKTGFSAATYHNDTSTAANPSLSITHSGMGLLIVSGGSSKGGRPDHDSGYTEGQGLSKAQQSGGSQWCWGNVSAPLLVSPSSYALQWRGNVSDYSVLADVIDVGGAGNHMAAIEGFDIFSAAGYQGAFGQNGFLHALEGFDTFAAAGYQPITARLNASEAPDRFSAFLKISIRGTFVVSEGRDTMHATGLGRGENGEFITSESVDIFVAAGYTPVSGTFTALETGDRARFIGNGVLSSRKRRTFYVT